MSLVSLDGTHGEGGGALLRTALAMSAITQQAVNVYSVRGATRFPGLDAEDLTLIRALAGTTAADVEGADLGSHNFSFRPKKRPQGFRNRIESVRGDSDRGANAVITLAALAPVAAQSGRLSSFAVEGETFGQNALGFDAFNGVTVPTLADAGLYISADLTTAGFGRESRGLVTADVEPSVITGLNWTDRGSLIEMHAVITTSDLPPSVGQRASGQLHRLASSVNLPLEVEHVMLDAKGPGCHCTVWARYERGAGSGSVMGAKGLRAEAIAQQAFEIVFDWMRSDSTIDAYLADQILLPLCFADSSSAFKVARLTPRFLTQIWVIKQFAPARITARGAENGPGLVTIER